jgi:hypothetical protein
MLAWVSVKKRMTYRVVDTPDGVDGQALNSSSSSIDGVELDTEDKSHLGVMSLDVNAVANSTKDACCDLNGLEDFDEVGVGELEGSIAGARLDGDRYLDLTFELVELSCVL